MNLKKYYEKNPFKKLFELDKNIFKHSQIRFKCQFRYSEETFFYKIRDNINNANDLQKQILKTFNRKFYSREKNRFKKAIPIKLYYMPAKFLDAEKLGGKNDKRIYLGHKFIVFDFDIDKIRNNSLENMRRQIIKLKKFMREKKFTYFYCIFSGQKGMQVSFKIKKRWSNDPLEREDQYKRFITKLIKEIHKRGIQIDPISTRNLRGIFKIPLSCSIDKVCKFIPNDVLESPRKFRRTMKGAIPPIDPNKKLGSARARIRAEPFFYLFQANSLISTVKGTKNRHALFMETDRLEHLTSVRRSVKRLIRIYNLGMFGIFKTKKGYHVVCPEALEFKRVLKILRNSFCDKNYIRMYENKGFFTLRVSRKKEMFSGRVVSPAPKFVELIEGKENKIYSRQHLNFLKAYTNIGSEKVIGKTGDPQLIRYWSGEDDKN